MVDPPSERARVHRHPERGEYDRGTIDAILDEALICHVAWVAEDGEPRIIPTIHARDGDTLYIHGSQASRTLRAIRAGAKVCVEVTILDALVLARSTPNHSMNYRSVVVYGSPCELTDRAEMDRAQRLLVEHVIPGRTADARMPSETELKETAIFGIALDEASAKVRTGGPKDPQDDLALPIWAGVLPLLLTPGEPEADEHLPETISTPAYVTDYRRPGLSS